ncbi:MAG: hypothetical protein IPP71_10205 [Bacteroidetes bacterium]|nr:hypothetical protein [Bacteroidota bacterium]
MKNTIKLLATITTIILMSSFTNKLTMEYIGTYGVCASDPSQIKLTINQDHTFYYQDLSIKDQQIIVEGNWTLDGKKVVLDDNNSTNKFHNVWTFAGNGQVAKSRKGLAFYRLTKLD